MHDYPSIRNTLYLNRDKSYVQSVVKSERQRRRVWVDALNREDPGCGRWAACATDDSDWESRSPFRPHLGSASRRPRVERDRALVALFTSELRPSILLRASLLRLGCLVDADSVFVNGRFVGTTSYQYPPRKYTLPGRSVA